MGSLSSKNILVLYDEKYSYIKTISEHLNSFSLHSSNNIFYLPATILGNMLEKTNFLPEGECLDLISNTNSAWDFELYDAIVIHYSVRVSLEGYLAGIFEEKLKKYSGLKVLFIQDEYENTDTAKSYIHRLGVDLLFTCVPDEYVEKIYSKAEFPELETFQTLTGYVPDDSSMEGHARPLEKRQIAIGYRGRKLPHHYGMLGYEKYIIGEKVREQALKRNIPVDISSDNESRIYGNWYSFLGSCRATLGTESGCNIFDFDGSLGALATTLVEQPFLSVYKEHFEKFDGLVQMNQISPKFFEAIKMRTALVCFEGSYSNILVPDKHYISLKKDFSNLDDVFQKLNDDSFLSKITSQAYSDIILSGKYSYKSFVENFDKILASRIRLSRATIITAPIAYVSQGKVNSLQRYDHRDSIINNTVLGNEYQRSEFSALIKARLTQSLENREHNSPVYPTPRESIRRKFISLGNRITNQMQSNRLSMSSKAILFGWKILPARIKKIIKSQIE